MESRLSIHSSLGSAGESNRAREACEHLSSTSAAGTPTPDTGPEFTHGRMHKQYIYNIPSDTFCDVQPLHCWAAWLWCWKYTQRLRMTRDMQLITPLHAHKHIIAACGRCPPETPEVTNVSKQHIGFAPLCCGVALFFYPKKNMLDLICSAYCWCIFHELLWKHHVPWH